MYSKANFDSDQHAVLFDFMGEINEKFQGEAKFLMTYNNDPYMIGASGVGKTAFFLYPNLEYACASGILNRLKAENPFKQYKVHRYWGN